MSRLKEAVEESCVGVTSGVVAGYAMGVPADRLVMPVLVGVVCGRILYEFAVTLRSIYVERKRAR